MRADIHDGPEHMLQSEAGYIDARPQPTAQRKTSCNARPDHTNGSGAESLTRSKSGLHYLRWQTSISAVKISQSGQQATSSATRVRAIYAGSANRRSDLTSAPFRPQTLQMKPAHKVGNGISQSKVIFTSGGSGQSGRVPGQRSCHPRGDESIT
jgi:hypothetical protein